jgi:hypothetical protein
MYYIGILIFFNVWEGGLMDIPFFNSKSSRLKKLIKEGKFQEAQRVIRKNPKLMKSLMKFLNTYDSELLSNTIYIISKMYIKYNKNVMDLIPYIRKFLKSDDENIVLNALISLKIILANHPECYDYVEDELWYVNRKFVNLQIREYVWDMIKNYGEGYKFDEEELRRAYERIKQLMNSPKQESLIKKLLNVGKSIASLIPNVQKLKITPDNINSSISKDNLEKRLENNYMALLKSERLQKSNPLNIAQCLSKLPSFDKSEIEEVIDNVLELLFSRNKVIRNITLNTIYNIVRRYPDVIYPRYHKLAEYAKLYGKSTTLELIIKEISKNYDIEHIF